MYVYIYIYIYIYLYLFLHLYLNLSIYIDVHIYITYTHINKTKNHSSIPENAILTFLNLTVKLNTGRIIGTNLQQYASFHERVCDNFFEVYGSDTSTIFYSCQHIMKKNWAISGKPYEFDLCIKFTYQPNKETIAFLDIKVSLRNGEVFFNLYIRTIDCHQYLNYLSAHPYNMYLAKLFTSVGYEAPRKIFKIIKRKWNNGSGKGSTQKIWSVLKWVKWSFPTWR